MKTETLRVERVVCRLSREVGVYLSREAPDQARELVGLAIDVLDPSWEVFDGSALASVTLMVWAYCLVAGGLVRAVSWGEELRVFVEDAAFRPGMRVEAYFGVELQRAWLDGGDAYATGGEAPKPGGGARKIGVVATVRVDGLALETVVLPVVTGIARREGCGNLQLIEEARSEQPGLPERAEQQETPEKPEWLPQPQPPEQPEQSAPAGAQAGDRRHHNSIRRLLERLRQLSAMNSQHRR